MSYQTILKTMIGILLLGGVVYLSAFAEQNAVPEEQAGKTTTKRVRVAAVEEVHQSREARFPAVTRAASRAQLGFTIGGRLIERPVEIGDRVKEGQVLARLDSSEPTNAVLSARGAVAELAARRAQTERDHERAQQLFDAKATTREEVEKTAAAVEALRAGEETAAARLAEAERLLAETELRAPFAGTVTDVLLEPGEHAAPGRGVVVLSGDGGVEVEVEVPESVLASVAVGDAVTVRLPVVGVDAVPATIKSVGRTAAGRGRLFPVVARLQPNPTVLAGMTAELVIRIRAADGALALPVEAIVNPGGRRPSVFRLTEDGGALRVEKLRVEVENLLGESVVVVPVSDAGAASTFLRPGDRVVVAGQHSLLDGETVEVN